MAKAWWRDSDYELFDRLTKERDEARAEVDRLRGIKPELPSRPPAGDGLPRYGLRWNGPTQPLAVPMVDGHWTPWHLAVQAVREMREAAARSVENADDGVPLQMLADDTIRALPLPGDEK